MISAEDLQDKSFGSNGDYTRFIRFAKVTAVYDSVDAGNEENYGTVSLVWLDSLIPVNGNVSYLKSGYSNNFGYGIVIVPSVGDIAACYTVAGAPPIILGFYSRRQFESVKSSLDNTDSVGVMPQLKAGEILIKGKSQSTMLFKNDGRIAISVKNGNDTTDIVNPDPKYTDTKFFTKSSADPTNTVVDLTLGLSDDMAGPGRSVINCSTGPAAKQIFELSAKKGVLNYSLGCMSGIEVIGLDTVKIYNKKSDGTLELKKVLDRNSPVSLLRSYYYNTGITDEISREHSCTMDSNSIVTSISLPPSIAGLLIENTLIQVTLYIKKPAFSLKVNEFGDLIVNCRNAVINAEDNKSQFGVFANSKIVANAVNTVLGNPLTGCITTKRDGVHLSAGMFPNAGIEEIEPKDIKSMTEDTFYFYILDEFPLIKYDPDDEVNPFKIVDAVEYKSLDTVTRNNIRCKPFDTTDDGFTRTKLDKLMHDFYAETNTIITYGQLKSI